MISELRGLFLLMLCAAVLIHPAEFRSRRRKFNSDDSSLSEDFEFADGDEAQASEWEPQTIRETNQESRESASVKFTNPTTVSPPPPIVLNYCAMVRCPPGSKCITKNRITLCVGDNDMESEHLEDVDDDDEEDNEAEDLIEEEEALEAENHKDVKGCTPCPFVKHGFVCGTDNRTYSSVCRLGYHNCVQGTRTKMSCSGFCPCEGVSNKVAAREEKIGQVNHRWKKFVNKYDMTVNNMGHKTSGSDGVSQNPIHSAKSSKQSKTKTSVNPSLAEDKEKQQGHNSVLSEKLPSDAIKKRDCSQQDLEVMGNRLLDWFSVVMADAKRNKSRRRSYGLNPATFPGYCKPEVKWMFHHLDQNSNAYLSLKELYDLEHESHEHCLKPFLEHCDVNKDMLVSSQEWCKCFDRSERPCAASRNRVRSGPRVVGSYNPECDETGFYRRTQCHPSVGRCWCVDKYGVEYANTRARGRPDCDSLVGKTENVESHRKFADMKPSVNVHVEDSDNDDDDDDEDDDDVEEIMEGSADKPLDI